MKSILLSGAAALALALAGGAARADAPAVARQASVGAWGVDLTAIDPSVKPGDDFFEYVNGGWARRTEIAPDRTSAGVGVNLVDQAEAQVRAIVEDLAKTKTAPGTVAQQVGDFYASWMDEAGIEARGTAPLAPYLADIAAIKDRSGLIRAFARVGFTAPAGLGILPDPADPTRYTAAVGQSGLGMPNRDYYLLEGAKYDSFRAAYRAYVEKMLVLGGIADAGRKADAIVALETAMAKVQWAPERSRDIKQIYNVMTVAQMTALAPQYEWPLYLRESKLDTVPTFIVAETTAIADMGKMLDTVPLATWKDYLAFHFISDQAPYLPRAFDEARFDFYSKTLRDVQIQRARWKRGIQLLNGNLGEAIGQLYVERHYPPESNAQMAELIANLRTALEARLAGNDWMDDATKKEALAKLATFDPRIGYPAKWIDYSSIRMVRGDMLGNAMRAAQFQQDLQLARLPKPVDRALWEMNPQEVNAYYNPLLNQITFPAAILQPPYFDPKADPAVNYGSIGAVIGHEIGHGFDDQGSQFDQTGKIRDWWTPGATEKFKARTAALGAQYDGYEPLPGLRVNGKLTMGENIGDLGGLEMAYAAYKLYTAKHGEPPVIDGLTGDQRFFLSYGQSWRGKRREGSLRELVLTDPHSPSQYRVNGVVRNVDAWYKAFDVKPGDALYLAPEARVHIW